MSLRPPGNLDPGLLDRRVTLQYSVPTRDAAGGTVADWYDAATVWAGKRPEGGGRLFAAEAKHYDATLVYRIRHRPDIGAGYRLIHGDDTYEIVAVAELGRRAYLDLFLRGLDQTPGDNRSDLDLGDGTTPLGLGDGPSTLNLGGIAA